MKKAIVIILFSMLFGLSITEIVIANPSPLFPFPLEQPVSDLPKVTVYSPIQDVIYNSSNIWLNFSIVKPDGWFQSKEYRDQGYGGQFGNITSVYYFIDGIRQEIPMYDVDSLCKGYPDKILNFSTPISLENGNHNLKVGCNADSYYVHIIIGQEFELLNITVNSESSIIAFENTNATASPSVPEFSWLTILPILLTLPIALAIVRKRL